MDAVITYVDGTDAIWQAQYAAATQQPALTKRYRDWGFLPYLFRGIEKYMPFVERVFLVVSSESQVPNWINREQVHVIFHDKIVPQEYLPTFNSGTIELFLHRIPELGEKYLYFNDDTFPVDKLNLEMFFQAEKVCTHLATHWCALNQYKRRARMQDRMAQYAAIQSGQKIKENQISFVRPQHTCTPMLKKESAEAFNAGGTEILSRITPLRTAQNPNQYFYTDYLYYIGKVVNRRISTKHCSMKIYSAKSIAKYIIYPKKSLVCINDVSMSDEKQERMRTTLLHAFEQRFPQKSRFEM